jgi:hypothetical protein
VHCEHGKQKMAIEEELTRTRGIMGGGEEGDFG